MTENLDQKKMMKRDSAIKRESRRNHLKTDAEELIIRDLARRESAEGLARESLIPRQLRNLLMLLLIQVKVKRMMKRSITSAGRRVRESTVTSTRQKKMMGYTSKKARPA